MKKTILIISICVLPMLIFSQTLKTSVFSAGGGASQSANYSSFGTFGQPLSVGTTGTNYKNKEGFVFAQQNIIMATITADETICYNTAASVLNSDYTGAEGVVTYQWQVWSGTDWDDITGEDSETCDPGNLTETTQFRLLVNDKSGIGQAISDTVTVTVRDEFLSGAIETTGETICYSGDPAEIGSQTDAYGGDESITYAWYKSMNNFTDSTLISGATAEKYDPPAGLNVTTKYRRYAHESTCNTDFEVSTGTWLVTVNDAFTPGAIKTNGETICYNGNPAEIGSQTDAAGGDETITYAWYKSTNNFTDSTLISGAIVKSYDPPTGLTATTSYRRYAKDETCNTVFKVSTGTWTVTVYDAFTTGSIKTDGETICFNENPAEISSQTDATGGDENIAYRWQSSTNAGFTGTPTDITNNAPSYDPPSGVTVDTWYRRQVKDGKCNTDWATSAGVWKVSIETENPVAKAKDITIYLNSQGEATITATDIDDGSSDNCSFNLSASKTYFNCSNIGANGVTLTVTDFAGNSDIDDCIVTVLEGSDIAPWVNANTSASANGSATYSPCNDTFRLTATGQSTTTNDVFHFVYDTIGTVGTIIARLADVENGGWAGVMMRESLEPNAKTILFKTRLYNPNVIIGYRTSAGSAMRNLSQVAQLIHWMKIQRNGNTFQVFTSYNGISWLRRYTGTISMGTEVLAGIFTESILSNRTSVAWFDNVELSGSLKTGDEFAEAEILNLDNEQAEVSIYPNPAKDEVNITMKGFRTLQGFGTLVTTDGKLVKTFTISESETQLNVQDLKPGVYILRIENAENVVIKRLVIQ